jgi:hypothetical protein
MMDSFNWYFHANHTSSTVFQLASHKRVDTLAPDRKCRLFFAREKASMAA